MKILVIGGTGMLGQPIVRRLSADGFAVRIMARDPTAARVQLGTSCEIVEGDVTRPETLRKAMDGCDGVHVSLKGNNTLESYMAAEWHGTMNIAKAAYATGVSRITHVSAAGMRLGVSRLMDIKTDAAATIQLSGVPFTIFEPTHFMESLPLFIRQGRAAVIGRQPHRYHYLAAADFASVVARAFRMPETAWQSYTLYGPEAYTMREALRIYCDLIHPGLRVGMLPIPVARAMGFLTGDRDLAFAGSLFDSFRRMGEGGDPAPAEKLFGAAPTRLVDWCTGLKGSIQ